MSTESSLCPFIEVGSLWGGGGMTVRVVEVHDDGVSVVRLTGRGRLLKRPSERSFMSLTPFQDGRMKPTTLPDSWKQGNS